MLFGRVKTRDDCSTIHQGAMAGDLTIDDPFVVPDRLRNGSGLATARLSDGAFWLLPKDWASGPGGRWAENCRC